MEEDQAGTFDGSTTSYRATFISYAHEDLTIARPLARMLADSGVPVWYDEWQLPQEMRGAELYGALRLAVARADAMIVLATPTHENRRAQKTPGWALAHAMAPPEAPLNDAPIPGAEGSFWTYYRSSRRITFSCIKLTIANGPGTSSVIDAPCMSTHPGPMGSGRKVRCGLTGVNSRQDFLQKAHLLAKKSKLRLTA